MEHGIDVNIPTDLLKILQSCKTLPSVPAVVIEVLNLAQNPEIGTAMVSKVISRDPALTARILKVANSAWCGIRRDVTTLNQAVNLLGLNGTMSLALSFSMARSLRAAGGPTFDHPTYWRRSAIAANAAASVGKGQTTTSQGELFLTGLLQDIGMLVLSEALPSYGQLTTAAAKDHRKLAEIERNELGTDHAQVGGWFLDGWKLPGHLVEAVNASHEKESIEGVLAKSVAVGGWIADIWINPKTVAATKAAAHFAEEVMGCSAEQFDEVLKTTAEELSEITANLDIPIGDEAEINKLLDQAREAIVDINIRALQEVQNLSIKAQHDPLTTLCNRTYLDQMLEEQFKKSKSASQPLTVIFMDIDNFKNINDTYGHNCGDNILVSVSQAISSAVRSSDIVGRFGGDEFVIILKNTSEETGFELAERIRTTVAKKPHNAGEGKHIFVTVSIGVSTLLPGSTISSVKELLGAADRHLYQAKVGGRNRVARAS